MHPRPMHLRTAAAVSLLSLSLLAACGGGGSGPSPSPGPSTGTPTDFGRLSALKPGVEDTLRTTLKVNVVFVGYRQTPPGSVETARQVNTADFQSTLPRTYDTIARVPSAYGTTERTGNAFDYSYNYVFADQAFEDDFFRFLAGSGQEQSLTGPQAQYNCQSDKVVQVKTLNPATLREDQAYTCPTPAANINRVITSNLEIDGRLTENWLADNASRLGVNPGEYTVFLVNWYDRPDFKFHSYTRADAGDTDLGNTVPGQFGRRGSRRLIAWGGGVREGRAPQRVWFYDLSANPDPWTQAYDVTNADLNGDKVADYRMPPIWEYGTRKASIGYGRKVSPDLARVVRYIAVNLLFTPSPIYRVALTPPRQPEEIELDLNVQQGAGAANRDGLLDAQKTQNRISVLQPFTRFSNVVRQSPLSGNIAEAYRCFFEVEPKDYCTPQYADAQGETLFRFGVNELRARYQGVPANKYLLPVYVFNDGTNGQNGLLGIAYDDNQTGTQTFVYSFLTPDLIKAGFGFTDTTVHEVGHHLSLSHPHDGYDSEGDLSYGPDGPFRYVDTGDESETVMTYNSLAVTFGQFNLDSQYRYLTSAYLNNTNAILELARRAGKVSGVASAAQSADVQFVQAKARYDAMSYLEAAQLAHSGYRAVLNAALAAGVNVQPYKWYENLNGLSAQGRKPRVSQTFLPQPGAVIFPEETKEQRERRLAP